jgi:Toprim domain
MVSFVMRFGSMDRTDAHRWIRERFAHQKVNVFNFHPGPTKQELDDAERKRARFVRLLKQSTAIKRTLSEQYLRDERNITPDTDFPTSLRHGIYNRQDETGTWHKLPALLGLALNKDGDVHCVHLVPLNNQGKKTGKTEFRTYKPGAAKGTAVILRKPISGILVVAEGLETALSVWAVVPEVGVIAVGSKENLKLAPIPPDTRAVIFAQDNDQDSEDGGEASERTYDAAAAHFRSLGFRVEQKMPVCIRNDWNDVLKLGCVDLIRQEFLCFLKESP